MTGPESESRASPGLETGCTANLTTAALRLDRAIATRRSPRIASSIRQRTGRGVRCPGSPHDLTPGHSLHRRRHVCSWRGSRPRPRCPSDAVRAALQPPIADTSPRADALAVSVQTQARRLAQRLAPAPAPQQPTRNPFAFGALPAVRQATPAPHRRAGAGTRPARAAIGEPALHRWSASPNVGRRRPWSAPR